MTLRAQFQESQEPPATVLPLPSSVTQFSLLNNQHIQVGHAEGSDFGRAIDDFLLRAVAIGRHQSMLAFLKSEHFKAEGREQRIRASLAALDAPQPIQLTLQQWIEVAREIEDED